MVQQLKAHTTLTEDLISGPSTNVRQLTTVTKSTPRDSRLSSGHEYTTHVYIPTYRHNRHTQMKYFLLKGDKRTYLLIPYYIPDT